MRPLMIGPEQQQTIKEVCDYAEAHKLSVRDLLAIIRGTAAPPGDSVEFTCLIPVGFRCVFTIEQQPSGWYRHLSVSVEGDKYPNEKAVEMLAKEFGFRYTLADRKWRMWLEEKWRAVNVLEPME